MNCLPTADRCHLSSASKNALRPFDEQRLMRVHSRAVLAEQRLRHEGRVVAVLLRDLLDDEAVREHVVRHVERVRVVDVDLVLGRADLVMVVLDRDPHRLERPDRVAADSGRRVHRRLREVAALVERLGAVLVLEQEVLRLRADVERVEAHRLHAVERASEREARVAVIRLAVRRDDVADHPAFQPVRQNAEGGRIGDRDHVRLLDRVEARDRRAVEAHAVVEGARQLAPRDREALQMPLEIGEPEQHVLDAARLDLREHGLPCLRVRRRPVLALNLRHHSFLPENAKNPGRRVLRRPRLRRLHSAGRVYTDGRR